MRKILLLLCTILLGCLQTAFAQNKQVSGTVTSVDGEPLIGVTVIVKELGTGTSTDIDGHYSIEAPAQGTLKFSFVGMKTVEAAISNRTTIDVTMEDEAVLADEVVVTGYAATRKAAFTGSAQVIDSKAVTKQTDANFMKALQGSVAGLQMFNVNGQPGAFASVNVRGVGSVNSGLEPLYVIDGMPMFSDKISALNDEDNGDMAVSPLANINPADIESVTVLKDATATAIYGARAANGVIVITTKRGAQGKPHVNFLAKKGIARIANLDWNYRVVNTDRYLDIWGRGLENSGEAAPGEGLALAKYYANAYYGWQEGVTPDTDWLQAILRNGKVDEYSVDVSGGANNTNYYISAGYYRNEGIIIGTDMKRYTLRSNIDHRGKVFSFGLLSSASYSDNNNVVTQSQYINPLVAVYDLRPIEPIYNEDGSYNLNAYYNPVAIRDKHKGDVNSQRTITANINPYVQVDFGKGFSAKSNLGINVFNLREYNFASMMNPQGIESHMYADQNNETLLNMTITNTLSWIKRYDKHDINLMLGQESQRLVDEQTLTGASNFPYEGLPEMGNASNPTSAGTYRKKSTLNSLFFNGQYSYADKYYISGSLRYDGSSRYGRNNQWGLFYSVGGKYRISEEEFMRGARNWLSNLTIRASYGTVGNQEIGWYSARAYYETGYDYKGNPGSVPISFANPDLKWERRGKFNVGLDLTLFRTINLEVDYYNELTSDMIFEVPITLTTGLAYELRNMGKMRNRGIEVLLNARLLSVKDFTWDMSFNITSNHNEIVALSTDLPIETSTTIRKVGEAYHTFYMPEYAGVDPDTGRPMWYKGTEGDEKTFNYNEAGQRIVGKADPKFYGGFSTTFRYKGIDLSATFSYTYGGKVYNSGFNYDMQVGDYFLGPVTNYVYENAWTPENRYTNVPQFIADDVSGASNTSSRFLMDGSYLKLRTLQVGYTFPEKICKAIMLSNLRVFFSADNLFTVRSSNFIGFDPETRADGFQQWVYPMPRNFIFGLSFGF